VFPGVALAITVFAFALIGSSIETLADPVRRRALLRHGAGHGSGGPPDAGPRV
jgi:hypothetical protein